MNANREHAAHELRHTGTGLSTAGRAPLVALVGMACNVPGARNVAELWDVLATGRSTISDVPRERFDASEWYEPDSGGRKGLSSQKGGFIDDAEMFDAA